MNREDLMLLFAYNRWANAKVLEASGRISADQCFAPVQVSFGSLMGNLAHILAAEANWRKRLQEGSSPNTMFTAADFPSLEVLVEVWHAEEARMQGFVESLSDADLNRWVEFRRLNGEMEGSTLWRALMHVVLHGVQFRGEAGAALAGFGQSPGDLDFIYYLRQTDQR